MYSNKRSLTGGSGEKQTKKYTNRRKKKPIQSMKKVKRTHERSPSIQSWSWRGEFPQTSAFNFHFISSLWSGKWERKRQQKDDNKYKDRGVKRDASRPDTLIHRLQQCHGVMRSYPVTHTHTHSAHTLVSCTLVTHWTFLHVGIPVYSAHGYTKCPLLRHVSVIKGAVGELRFETDASSRVGVGLTFRPGNLKCKCGTTERRSVEYRYAAVLLLFVSLPGKNLGIHRA